MSILDVAMKWKDFGVSPIPIMRQSKRPLVKWTEYQERIPNNDEIKNWFSNDRLNLGLVCGGLPNMVVLDFDNLKNYYGVVSTLKKASMSVIEQTYRVMTSRGIHVYLSSSQPESTTRIKSITLDIKAKGGYVLTPPSIHPDGAQYTELGGAIQRIDSVADILGNRFNENVVAECVRMEQKTEIEQMAKEELKKGSSFFEKLYVLKKYMNIIDIANMFTYMQCTTADGRWWYGRCPHPCHEDRHPSFRIDAAYGIGKCLSYCALNTPKGFDLLDLYCACTGKNNKQALDELVAPFIR